MESNARLSTTEIAGLWTSYINDSAVYQVLTYFIEKTTDEEILPLLHQGLENTAKHLNRAKEIFQKENFPEPQPFSEHDINLDAPALFYDIFSLSFVYGISRIHLLANSEMMINISRPDVLQLFSDRVTFSKNLYEKSVTLMLKKGIYDQAPKIPYPTKIEYVQKQSFLTGWFGERRPLNAIELTELFFNIERNYFGIILLQGLTQVVKDEELQKYLLRGKEIAEKQVNIFDKLLKEEDLLGLSPVAMEVTNSTIPPFSDRLIMYIVNALSAAGVTYTGHGLSTGMRRDLATHYMRILTEIMQYVEDGFNIMIDRGWMQQPPQAPNRRELIDN